MIKIHSTPDGSSDPFTLSKGSGARIFADSTSLYSRHTFLDVATHEHGHYLFGSGHRTYAKMSYSGGFNGWEFSLSP